jgi:hypothetical protein
MRFVNLPGPVDKMLGYWGVRSSGYLEAGGLSTPRKRGSGEADGDMAEPSSKRRGKERLPGAGAGSKDLD